MNSEFTVKENKKSEELSFKELILIAKKWYDYLFSNWILIVILGITGGIIGFFYASFQKPIYTASTTFVLESSENSGGIGQYAGLASMVGIDLGGNGGDIFQGDNLLELYKSRKMIEKTLLSPLDKGSSRLLIDRYIDFNELKESWKKKPELINLRFNNVKTDSSHHPSLKLIRLRDSILGSIVDDINKSYLSVTKPDKKLSIIRVDVKSKDELFAKSFNDRIVENVNDFYKQTKIKKSLNNIGILQHKTDSVRAVMNGAIYTAAAVADATPNLNPTRQLQRAAPVQRSQFNAETNKAVLGALVQNLEMSKMTLLRETPLIQVIDSPVFPLFKQKTGKIKSCIIGGFLFGFFTCLILILKRLFKIILA